MQGRVNWSLASKQTDRQAFRPAGAPCRSPAAAGPRLSADCTQRGWWATADRWGAQGGSGGWQATGGSSIDALPGGPCCEAGGAHLSIWADDQPRSSIRQAASAAVEGRPSWSAATGPRAIAIPLPAIRASCKRCKFCTSGVRPAWRAPRPAARSWLANRSSPMTHDSSSLQALNCNLHLPARCERRVM